VLSLHEDVTQRKLPRRRGGYSVNY